MTNYYPIFYFLAALNFIEKELEDLIMDNKIQECIDSHNKILYAHHADQCNTTFQHVLQNVVEFDTWSEAIEAQPQMIYLPSNYNPHYHALIRSSRENL
jgi:hypothetical protein